MDYGVKTFFYTQVSEGIPHGCMKILISPDEKKRPTQIVVGDQKGQFTYFEMKDSSLAIRNKTNPTGKPPARFEKLSGAKANDRFITAFGAQVEAFNAEAKQYFVFDSNLAENLKWVRAEDNAYVFACGEFILNFFEITDESIEDLFQYICPSEILDFYVESLDGINYQVILSCKDKRLRVVNSSGVIYETKLDYNAYCLYPMNESSYDLSTKKAQIKKQLLLGMANGDVRCYTITMFETKLDWSLRPHPGGTRAEPSFIRIFKLTQKQKGDIIVLRSDGTIDIYSPKETTTSKDGQYDISAHMNLGETVTGIEGAFFNSKPELIITGQQPKCS